ncbi:hypothetical protein BDU57DRAFT_368935 [Ampelomyces quisqualis]|uniref:Uncharacterized protein n=1 Tax=Ampelomyces quisqualis TaxID=50730 RepID=A0A6A5QAJ6_AMPQU|nr:hypothetical protein BDU57DRAFT_368935 [Ampelomyces quisqualis]
MPALLCNHEESVPKASCCWYIHHTGLAGLCAGECHLRSRCRDTGGLMTKVEAATRGLPLPRLASLLEPRFLLLFALPCCTSSMVAKTQRRRRMGPRRAVGKPGWSQGESDDEKKRTLRPSLRPPPPH